MASVATFEELVSALQEAGLWSDIADDHKHALIQALMSGDDVTWTAGGIWRADGEDLADGDVETWLGSMAAALRDCGVELRVATVIGPFDEGSTGYSVRVNDRLVNLYTFSADQRGLPVAEDPWMDCSIYPAAEVNRLLETAGSKHRLALFWPGGNDGLAVLGEVTVLRRVRDRSQSSGSWDCVVPNPLDK